MEAKIALYKINKFGYYRFGGERAEFGSIPLIFDELSSWSRCVEFKNSNTFEVTDSDSLDPTYCYKVSSLNGRFLVTMWNAVPTTENNAIVAINGNAMVGQISNDDVETNEFDDGYIPGFATYFWVIPELNSYATIQFNHLKNGKANFEKYIKCFLAKLSSHCIYADEETFSEENLLGYQEDEFEEILDLLAMFEAKPYNNPAEIDFIRSSREDIKKIIKKNKIFLRDTDSLSLYEKMANFLGFNQYSQTRDEVNIRYEMSMCPTESELNSIIGEWSSTDNYTRWDDVGFRIYGKDYWLSHSRAKALIDVDINHDNAEVVNSNSLLNELERNYEIIRNLMR